MKPTPRRMPEPDYSGAKYVKDDRSPLKRALGTQSIPHQVVPFPGSGDRFGKEHKIGIRALSTDQQIGAIASAVKYLTEVAGIERADLYTEHGDALLDLESKIEALALSLCVPAKPHEAFAASAQELRESLETEEIAYLWDQYLEWQGSRSQYRKLQTLEQMREYWVALGKGLAPKTSLNSFDATTLRRMLHELAVQHWRQMKTRSSGTGARTSSGE